MKHLMNLMTVIVLLAGAQVKAAGKGCETAEKSYASSLTDFRMAKGFYCQAYLNCGTAYGFPATTLNIDVILSVPGGDDAGYDSCMAPYMRELNETAKNLTAWELARCEEHEPEADIYYLCSIDGQQARGGTANRHLAPLPLHSVARN